MLPVARRLSSGTDIRNVVRRGYRASSGVVTVHLLLSTSEEVRPARAGVIVGRKVGNSVVRHRVQRRLRHLLIPHVDQLPSGAALVVRPQPAAATASSSELGGDLDRALRKVHGGQR